MKNFVNSIPFIVPCVECSTHALRYVEMHNIDEIVKHKDSLINFFVDFHNQVNIRKNKPDMTYVEAKKMYGNNSRVKILKY